MVDSLKNETSILIIGDYHMKRLKEITVDDPEVSKFENFKNITWKCSNWANLKSAKNTYFKHRNLTGCPPSVVVVSVGNNDLQRLSKPHYIITNLLRAVKTFYNDGVSVVIICSLPENESAAESYYKSVKHINYSLFSRTRKFTWVKYLKMYEKKWLNKDEAYLGNKLMPSSVYEKVAKGLRTKLKSNRIKSLIDNDKGNQRIVKKRSLVSGTKLENSKNLFLSEINTLKIRIEKLQSEKEKYMPSEFIRTDKNIVTLKKYWGNLEELYADHIQPAIQDSACQQTTHDSQNDHLMAETSKDDTSILVIGDFHMKRLKEFSVSSALTASKFEHFVNITWDCSIWANIRSSKKSYFKHRNSTGHPPRIVVLSVGNNDMLKITNPNCIITNLLRAAKTFYNDGVSVVIICSLVEQETSVGDYNKNVNFINGILLSKARKLEWLHYLLMYSDKWFKNQNRQVYATNKLLIGMAYHKVAKNLQILLKSKKIRTLIANDKGNRKIVNDRSISNSGIGSLDDCRKNLFKTEINSLKIKIEKLEEQKEKYSSVFAKTDRTITSLQQYVEKLEALSSGRNQQPNQDTGHNQQTTQESGRSQQVTQDTVQWPNVFAFG